MEEEEKIYMQILRGIYKILNAIGKSTLLTYLIIILAVLLYIQNTQLENESKAHKEFVSNNFIAVKDTVGSFFLFNKAYFQSIDSVRNLNLKTMGVVVYQYYGLLDSVKKLVLDNRAILEENQKLLKEIKNEKNQVDN